MIIMLYSLYNGIFMLKKENRLPQATENNCFFSQSTSLYVKQREKPVFKRFFNIFDDAFDGK